ncbi:MAG: hypothetical protein E7649_06835 [Ruminococcaceae bacterium]|nr:hypothetical protein [Oscillospiraceae bacterium]
MFDFVEQNFEQRLHNNELVERIVRDFFDSFVEFIGKVRDSREKRVSFTCYFNVTCKKVCFFHDTLGFEQEFGWFNFSVNRYPDLSLEEAKVMAKVLADKAAALLKEMLGSQRIHNDTNVRITERDIKVKKAKSSDFSVVSGVKYSAQNGCYSELLTW